MEPTTMSPMEEWMKMNPIQPEPFQHNQNSLDFGMRYANAPDMSQYASMGGLMGLGNSMQQNNQRTPMQPSSNPKLSYLQSLLY